MTHSSHHPFVDAVTLHCIGYHINGEYYYSPKGATTLRALQYFFFSETLEQERLTFSSALIH